jgi:multisubunit Na+/H+ antiporter MnhC subunit
VAAGVLLAGMGLYRLLSRRHFRWVGMRLSAWELGVWSFLMSSVHGAGLMLVPVLAHHATGAVPQSLGQAAAASLLHTVTMLLTAGVVGLAVLEVLGLGVLRRAWVNVDRIWAVALIGAGAATVLTA